MEDGTKAGCGCACACSTRSFEVFQDPLIFRMNLAQDVLDTDGRLKMFDGPPRNEHVREVPCNPLLSNMSSCSGGVISFLSSSSNDARDCIELVFPALLQQCFVVARDLRRKKRNSYHAETHTERKDQLTTIPTKDALIRNDVQRTALSSRCADRDLRRALSTSVTDDDADNRTFSFFSWQCGTEKIRCACMNGPVDG